MIHIGVGVLHAGVPGTHWRRRRRRAVPQVHGTATYQVRGSSIPYQVASTSYLLVLASIRVLFSAFEHATQVPFKQALLVISRVRCLVRATAILLLDVRATISGHDGCSAVLYCFVRSAIHHAYPRRSRPADQSTNQHMNQSINQASKQSNN